MRILHLDLDTTRPDHLGCYGYPRNTSPNLDRVAAEGVRFTNYYCSDAPCLPSRTALMSGRFGIHTGVVGHGGTAADMRLEGASRGFGDRLRDDALPAFLKSAGFRTVSISPFAERHSAWHFLAGFAEIHNTGRRGSESAEEVTPAALKWIRDQAAQDNWYLHVNYWDPHTPYRAPAEFGNPFKDVPAPDWVTEEILQRQRTQAGPHGPCEVSMFNDKVKPGLPRHLGQIRNRDDIKQFFDGYDCGIAYMDSHVGQLFRALEAQGVMDDLTIIISSDHGENLGELGIWGEHATADYTTCRIPMIVRSPGIRGGRVDAGLHYQLDLAPTLAELLGREPAPRWDGRSYAAALRSGADAGRDYVVISQCAHVCQRGVRWGPWLYMRTWHCGYHLFPREMLFNIAEDPHEQRNLAPAQPALCRQGADYLMDWHDRMMSTMPEDVDPLWTVIKEGGPSHARGRLARYCERLKSTGRAEAAEELRRKYPGEFAPGLCAPE